MITERVKEQFFYSFIRRVIGKYYIFDAPRSLKGVFISWCWNPEVIDPTKKKKLSAHTPRSRVCCHCPPVRQHRKSCPVANVWCFWWKVLESNVTLLTGTVICITFHDKSLPQHLVWPSVIDCHLQIYGLGGWNGFNFCPFLSMDCRISSDSSYYWCVRGTLLIAGFHGFSW